VRAVATARCTRSLTDTGEVVEIYLKTATVMRRWSAAPCKRPVAMAIDTAHQRLFSGCRSGVMAISEYRAARVVARVPIGAGVDGAGFEAASGNAFASNADGTLTVIHQDAPDQYHLTETLQTPQYARQHGARSRQSRGRGPMLPGSFSSLVIARDAAVH